MNLHVLGCPEHESTLYGSPSLSMQVHVSGKDFVTNVALEQMQ